jgi:hypothetical protein
MIPQDADLWRFTKSEDGPRHGLGASLNKPYQKNSHGILINNTIPIYTIHDLR